MLNETREARADGEPNPSAEPLTRVGNCGWFTLEFGTAPSESVSRRVIA